MGWDAHLSLPALAEPTEFEQEASRSETVSVIRACGMATAAVVWNRRSGVGKVMWDARKGFMGGWIRRRAYLRPGGLEFDHR